MSAILAEGKKYATKGSLDSLSGVLPEGGSKIKNRGTTAKS